MVSDQRATEILTLVYSQQEAGSYSQNREAGLELWQARKQHYGTTKGSLASPPSQPPPVCKGWCVRAQSCLTLCNCTDYSLPGSSVHRNFQARILERVTISSAGDLPDPGIEPTSPESPSLAGRFFTTEPLGKPTYKGYKPVIVPSSPVESQGQEVLI